MKNNDVLEYFVSTIILLQHKIDDLMVVVSESRHNEILTDSENKKLIAENERLSKELKESEYIKDEFWNNYQRVCHTMTQMYQIVTKNTDGGPKQGVIEDIEAKIEEYEAELEFFRKIWASLEHNEKLEFKQWYESAYGNKAPEIANFKPKTLKL